MTDSSPDDSVIARLEDEERRIILPRFDLEDAWTLGSSLAERARAEKYPVLLDIRRGEHVLFRAVLPGSTPDHQFWAARKAALVQRMEASSALVTARMAASGTDPFADGWLDHRYVLAGGSFPVRVAGVGVVGAVTASGMTSEEDHALVVSGLETLLTQLQS
ncbi:MAG: heme-degrading domain-containing protein [Janthinobacterium lividum]